MDIDQMRTTMNKNGFTLVEIAIVTSLVGMMAVLASMAVINGFRKSQINQSTVELDKISTAVLQLAWDTGKWPNGRARTDPGSAEVWDLSVASAGMLESNGSYTDWRGPYCEDETLDPWGNPYFFDPDYRVDGVMRIVVGSFGPNGVGRNLYDEDDIYVLLDD